jgi:crotonobetainyl-CoA:carnitine CoA-transferase CaiB-like acyl-CoA transferase
MKGKDSSSVPSSAWMICRQAARGMLRRLASADLGSEITVPAAAFKLNGEAPGPTAPPRRAGADTTAILEELGYKAARIAELASLGMVATEA